jgi:hypothetical protein
VPPLGGIRQTLEQHPKPEQVAPVMRHPSTCRQVPPTQVSPSAHPSGVAPHGLLGPTWPGAMQRRSPDPMHSPLPQQGCVALHV